MIEISKKKKKSEEDKEMLEWYGTPLNESFEEYYAFDLEDVNEMLLEVFEK
jgi:L-arabinose isomerase